jgi:hypothetical protein
VWDGRLIEDVPDGAGSAGSRVRGAADGCGVDAQAFEREGGTRAVAQESLASGAVAAVDADRSVEAEAACGLPGEHVVDGRLVEELAAPEEAEHAAGQRLLETMQVAGAELAGGGEAQGSVRILGEEPVEDDEVVISQAEMALT